MIMRFLTIKISGLLICSALLSTWPAACQTAELNGKVRDAVDNSPINGVDVAIQNSAGALIARLISGADGHYSAPGLKSGDHVKIFYRHGGYLPHPAGPVEKVLSSGPNTQDLELVHDANDELYWLKWAKAVKAAVDSYTPENDKRIWLYNQDWSSLGIAGFSPIAQAQAARQLAAMTPEAPHSGQLQSFASVDLNKLEQADSGIRAAINGQAELSNQYSIPPDVAVAIAASELKKNPGPAPQPEFMQRFGEVWGRQATDDLSHTLAIRPTQFDFHSIDGRALIQANKPKD